LLDKEERLKNILKILSSARESVSGTVLAKKLGVTRQVIVQDIALLKSRGVGIISTARGYVLNRNPSKYTFMVAVKHTEEMIRSELECVVENGGEVIDVVVEHPIYGEIRKMLNIKNSADIERFMAALKTSNASPLMTLSNGVHIHTIGVNRKEDFEKISNCLEKMGILLR